MDINPDYDAIVIGAGPAGVAAAISAKKRGLSVLIITEARTFDDNIIESVHSGISALLSKIDCVDCLTASIVGEYSSIESAGKLVRLGGDTEGYYVGFHINKSIFDEKLITQAKSFQIEVITNEKISNFLYYENYIIGIVTSKGMHIRSKYVIDASGYKRFGANKLKFKEERLSPPLISWAGISHNIEPNNIIFDKTFPSFIPISDGWIWIAPLPTTQCHWTILRCKGNYDYCPPEFLKSYPYDPNIRKANRRWGIYRPLYAMGLILCGEAACIMDPASGQGILTALYTGIYASKAVFECVLDPGNELKILNEYDRWLYSQYSANFVKLKQYYQVHGIIF